MEGIEFFSLRDLENIDKFDVFIVDTEEMKWSV